MPMFQSVDSTLQGLEASPTQFLQLRVSWNSQVNQNAVQAIAAFYFLSPPFNFPITGSKDCWDSLIARCSSISITDEV